MRRPSTSQDCLATTVALGPAHELEADAPVLPRKSLWQLGFWVRPKSRQKLSPGNNLEQR